ncbi:MAG: hypothetical protein SPJ08_02615 [Sphaerochaetaceae bacterium]|nr:hypothetical protein [Sphaerochaetaceae bacterium]
MTIDEAIEQQKEKAKLHRESIIPKDRYYNMPHVDSANKSHTFYAEEHEQLAEWLEELKAYKETKCNKSVYLANKSIDMIDAVNKGYADGYNNAIDDFAEKLHAKCDGMINNKWNSNVSPVSWAEAYADFKDDIDEITEQLNGGGENE